MKFKEWLAKVEATDQAAPSEQPTAQQQEVDPTSGWRYGNYCGPGPKFDRKTCDRLADGRPLPQPINAVDAACKVHDTDYCGCNVDWKAGFLFGKGTPCSREADVKLIKTLGGLAKERKFSSHGEWIAANLIRNYFRLHNWMQRGTITTI
jgi:hypothetical protein